MKHMIDYTREEIIKCLTDAGLAYLINGTPITDLDTELLREYLSDACTEGDASELERSV